MDDVGKTTLKENKVQMTNRAFITANCHKGENAKRRKQDLKLGGYQINWLGMKANPMTQGSARL